MPSTTVARKRVASLCCSSRDCRFSQIILFLVFASPRSGRGNPGLTPNAGWPRRLRLLAMTKRRRKSTVSLTRLWPKFSWTESAKQKKPRGFVLSAKSPTRCRAAPFKKWELSFANALLPLTPTLAIASKFLFVAFYFFIRKIFMQFPTLDLEARERQRTIIPTF